MPILFNVLRLFADVANLNMILAPDVKGKVTVRMVNIPWDQALDIILKMNGLGFALDDNIFRIASVGAFTKEAEEETRAKEAKKKAEDLVTRIVSINYAKASEINGTLKNPCLHGVRLWWTTEPTRSLSRILPGTWKKY